MTEHEAVQAIKSNYPPANYTMLREALDMSIEVLGKQIPYKPEEYHGSVRIGEGICKCGAVFLDKHTNYCGNCGQRLDWEGDNGID